MKKRIGKSKFGILNCLALVLVTATANAACIWYFHQPEFPKEANMVLVTATANAACILYFYQPEFPKEANALRKHYND